MRRLTDAKTAWVPEALATRCEGMGGESKPEQVCFTRETSVSDQNGDGPKRLAKTEAPVGPREWFDVWRTSK